MPIILLTKGFVAQVSPEDFRRFGAYRWQASETHPGRVYATRTDYAKGRKRLVYLHRAILNAPPGTMVDHVNGDSLDCWRSNLRLVTPTGNSRNRCADRTSTSSFIGVSWDARNRKWIAQIKYDGRNHFLGRFTDEAAAARAYDVAAREHFGEHARPNFTMDGRTL